MGEYFRPFRRKLGLIVLVVACAFVAGWVRSMIAMDGAKFYFGHHTKLSIVSTGQSLLWERRYTSKAHDMISVPDWKSHPAMSLSEILEQSKNATWYWQSSGFGYGEILLGTREMTLKAGYVPYWSIVVPLTAFSAWLLLSKPRSKPTAG